MKRTYDSLHRWNNGDRAALEELVSAHLSWLRAHVSNRLGPRLRRKAETEDFLQDALVEFLLYGPRIVIDDEDRFRALLVRIVENTLRDKNDWFKAKRRTISRERPLPPDTILNLDPRHDPPGTPSAEVDSNERRAWIRLGMELSGSDDREVLVLRNWDRLSFSEIGEELGISEDAARMRHKRAMGRLAETVGRLRRGQPIEDSA